MTPHSCKELYDKIKDTPEYQRELELYDRGEKIAAMKAELRKRLAKTKAKRRVEAWPPPRYDDVYFEGVAWLDENG